MVAVGSFCIDKYEASVWSAVGGGSQYGVSSDDYPCNDKGQNCTNIYARSLSGVKPSAYITWFQAQQACSNVGKRLATSAEWQQAVAGTPDPGAAGNGMSACNTNTGATVNTGSISDCVANGGAYDMVGNVGEWVADWKPAATACPGWGGFSGTGDDMCLAGAATGATTPGAVIRGGDYGSGALAGPLNINALSGPSPNDLALGFRCAR